MKVDVYFEELNRNGVIQQIADYIDLSDWGIDDSDEAYKFICELEKKSERGDKSSSKTLISCYSVILEYLLSTGEMLVDYKDQEMIERHMDELFSRIEV